MPNLPKTSSISLSSSSSSSSTVSLSRQTTENPSLICFPFVLQTSSLLKLHSGVPSVAAPILHIPISGSQTSFLPIQLQQLLLVVFIPPLLVVNVVFLPPLLDDDISW